MWVTFVTKCAAIVTATLLASGIVWSAQQGDGKGNNAVGPTSESGINLQVAADDAAKANQVQTTVVAPKASQTAQEAARQQEQYTQKLKGRIEDLDDELRSKMDARSDKAARLEMEQIEKTSLQRELEHLRGMLLELDLPMVTPSDEKTTREAQQKRLETRDIVAARIESIKKQLEEHTLGAALMTSELERRQLEVTRTQRRLEELDRRSIQLEFPDEVRGHAQAAAATPAIADERLGPHDIVRILVANAFADAPISDEYPVESMGTVALGPSYGRVKVAGLTVLEAEEVIKRELGKVIDGPIVQVTMSERSPIVGSGAPSGTAQITGRFVPPTPADIDSRQATYDVTRVPTDVENQQVRIIEQLQRAHDALKKENAELKKQLEQKASVSKAHVR